MELSDALIPERVVCGIEARSKKHALEILSALLAVGATEQTELEIFTGLNERERLGTTSLGNGVVMPHSRDPALDQPVAALMTLTQPVDFDTADDRHIDIVFGLLLPGDEASTDLSRIADTLRQADCVALLRRADSPETACEVVAARLDRQPRRPPSES